MIPRPAAIAVGLAVLVGLTAWVLFAGLPRWYGRSPAGQRVSAPAAAPVVPGRKIKAGLFYVSDDGLRLTRVERDVAFGEGTVEQARQIIEAQIAPAASPLVSAVPEGTKLRTIFVTPGGDAFVDLSSELVTGHSGGSTNELLTIYSIVNALCANLPAVHSVELLVDGKQMETLAGHVDLRRPLEKNLAWVQ
jgi:spore germination protein GerM